MDEKLKFYDHIHEKVNIAYSMLGIIKRNFKYMDKAAFLHCVSKKRNPFYFSENLAKYYPISIIFGSSIPEEICNKSLHVYPPHLFTVLIP